MQCNGLYYRGSVPSHKARSQILQFNKRKGTLCLKSPTSDDNCYYDNDNNHHHHNLIFISCRLHNNVLICILTSLKSKTNL